MTIVFGPNLHVPWVLLLVSRVTCLSIYLCFLSVFGLGTGAVFSKANGEPMAVLVRSLVTLFISVFLSGFECVSLGRLCWLYCGRVLLLECVCLPALCSPSVAFVGCTVVFLGSELVLLKCACLPSLCSPLVAFVGCTVVFLGSELVLLECACLPSRCSPRSPFLVALLFFLR